MRTGQPGPDPDFDRPGVWIDGIAPDRDVECGATWRRTLDCCGAAWVCLECNTRKKYTKALNQGFTIVWGWFTYVLPAATGVAGLTRGYTMSNTANTAATATTTAVTVPAAGAQPQPQPKGKRAKGGKGKPTAAQAQAVQFAANNAKAQGRAAGNVAAAAAAVPAVLALAVQAGLAQPVQAGATYYKPAPTKGTPGGYRAAAVALAGAMHKASGGKGYQPHQFKAALLALAPNAYKGGQWHTWLVQAGWWLPVGGK